MSALLMGDRLTPVTREEAAELSRGLLTLVERHPWLGRDPLMVAFSRLLLAVPDTRVDLTPELERLKIELWQARQLNSSLEEDLGSAQIEAEAAQDRAEQTEQRAQELISQAGATAEHYRKEQVATAETAAKLQAELKKLTEELAALQKTQGQKDNRQVEQLRESLNQTRAELAAASQSFAAIQTKLNLAQNQFQKLSDEVKELEWRGYHPTYTYTSTRKKVPCCPFCQGLDPSEAGAGHRDAGHKRDCAYLRLKKLL
jgi:hypothetical protein